MLLECGEALVDMQSQMKLTIFEVRNILEHYRKVVYISNDIYVSTISAVENKPIINWNSLDEWEGITGADEI